MVLSDIPILRGMYQHSGFTYLFPDLSDEKFESVLVVVDENNAPIMAAAAERIVQLYLFCGDCGHPASKLHAIRLLHSAMNMALLRKHYTEANAFLPPQIEKSFGKRLEKSFHWVKNWASYAIRVE